ncbi:MAG: GNAT family N-acetyltransferase [Stellaceae bacterium]
MEAISAKRISFETCRPVEDAARQVMAWRNDVETLAMSFHCAPKVWDAFWPEFRSAYFRDPPPPLFALLDGKRIAFLRFRPVAHPRGFAGTTVDISIIVAPEARGQGLGTAVLVAVGGELSALRIDSVLAEVREENSASLKAFGAAGYDDLGPTEKRVEDTGEQARVRSLVCELVPAYWRRGRVFVVAEAGSNWRAGNPQADMDQARRLIDVAAAAGADAVKFQTYRAETVYVADAGESDYLAASGIKKNIREIFADLEMPYDMLPKLAEEARARGLQFMSTGFSPADFAAIDPLVTIHKIASYEIGHLRLLDLAAKSGKPLLLSTGAAEIEDIAWAVDRFRAKGGRDLCLMQCTAKYPASFEALNLAVIDTLRRRFGVAVGLSDHSRDPVTAPVAAVALGARAIAKHFTPDNKLPGPDHAFALEPHELKLMVTKIREAEAARGSGVKEIGPEERELASFARRGVQATRAIRKGERLHEGQNIDILRPGKQSLGVHPRYIEQIEGCAATRDIAAGQGLQLGDWA